MHKFGYSDEQLKLREYEDLKDLLKSQEKKAQNAHYKSKEDFENELENCTEDQKVITQNVDCREKS